MTKMKLREVFKRYVDVLTSMNVTSRQLSEAEYGAKVVPEPWMHLSHVLWMSYEALATVIDGNPVKANRWLGYVQGVLAHAEVFSINELRDHSRTVEPDYFIVGPSAQRSLMGQICVVVEDYHDVQSFVLVEFPDIVDKDKPLRRLLSRSVIYKPTPRQADFLMTHGTMREHVAATKPSVADLPEVCVNYQRSLISHDDDPGVRWHDYDPTFCRAYAQKLGR